MPRVRKRNCELWLSSSSWLAATFLFSISLAATFPIARGAGERVHLAPNFSVGESLHYRINTVTTTNSKTTSPVIDPQAGSKLKQTIELTVSFNILRVQPATADEPGRVRFTATYDDALSHTETDTFNPNPTSADAQYAQLKGRTVEFALDLDDQAPGGGSTGRASGSDAATGAEAAAFSWLKGLPLPEELGRNGIEVGQKWTSEHAVAGLPFTDVVWHAESTYLRNEACTASSVDASQRAPQAAAAEMCGVVLTRFEISRRGGEHTDATPQDYREHALRTEGKLGGTGESLDSVSLATGLLVSSTQTSAQDADYEIISEDNHRDIHHVAHVEIQSEIEALPPETSGS